MSEAMARREELRQYMLKEGAKWDFAYSSWEAAICKELTPDAVVVVRRVALNVLAMLGLQPNECHSNARRFAEHDTLGITNAVTGWWVQWPNFLLHSVVERNGELFCVTPAVPNEAEIEFIPDPKISWVKEGNSYTAYRDSHPIGPGVRAYPDFTAEQCAAVRARLLAGVDPYEACNFSPTELSELKRKYIQLSNV